MSTSKRKKNSEHVGALAFLKKLSGGPLSFGDALRAVREREGLTQVALAERMGVGRQTVCDLEHGRRLPSPGHAAKYARALLHHEGQFVRLALQDHVSRAGLKLKVKVEAA
ncbi:MAG: helix-turn-helix transcriptional regulator [Myxococcales bacterium FL481]|nr:MAG: helix-turn-helix transcriptional regulator [Myxococcales bacterium FL481]